MRLPESIHVIERGWLSSNNVVFFEGDSATLVDSGYVGHAPQTIELVRSVLETRRRPAHLRRLINTHSHSDHIGGNAALQSAFGCSIVIPGGIEPVISEWDTHALLLSNTGQRNERFAHDEVIDAGSEFGMGGLSWRALAAPGHDMHALVYYCAKKRILISGDALWQDGFGILFGEVMGRTGTLAVTRSTLDMIGGLAVDMVIPGHGAPFADFEAAMVSAYKRLASFEADPTRMGRNVVRACFTFNLLDHQRMREDDLPAYLKSVPLFDSINQQLFALSDEDFAAWLLGELMRSHSIEVRDGWILPTMAP